MSFISSLFSCCFSDTENEKADAEARHARIVSMYAGNTTSPDSPTMQPPPSYAEIANDTPVVVSDEKRAPASVLEPELLQRPPEARRSSVSSRSSIVSVPSTRLSHLTSMYTGTTQRGRDGERDNTSEWNGSWRSRRWGETDDSAPPSYYAGSTRSVTPVPTPPLLPTILPAAVLHDQHPVMQEGWLEGLMFDADRQSIPTHQLSDCQPRRRSES